jgi:hypothetical protein
MLGEEEGWESCMCYHLSVLTKLRALVLYVYIYILWANTNLVSQHNKLRSIIKRSEDEAKVEDIHLSNARFIQKLKASFHCKQQHRRKNKAYKYTALAS